MRELRVLSEHQPFQPDSPLGSEHSSPGPGTSGRVCSRCDIMDVSPRRHVELLPRKRWGMPSLLNTLGFLFLSPEKLLKATDFLLIKTDEHQRPDSPRNFKGPSGWSLELIMFLC